MSTSNIKLRKVDYIVGKEPSWIVRFGISLILFVFLASLLIATVISYPDTISAPIEITTEEPPIEIFAQTDGIVAQLYVDDKEVVENKQLLALIRNTANYSDILKLEKFVHNFKLDYTGRYDISKLQSLELGELQIPFNNFISSIKEHLLNLKSLEKLENELNVNQLATRYEALNVVFLDKKKLLEEKLALELRALTKYRELANQGLIPVDDVLPFEREYLNRQIALQDIDIIIHRNTTDLAEKKSQADKLHEDINQQIERARSEIISNLLELQNSLKEWRSRYILLSPKSGIVAFTHRVSIGDSIKVGEALLSVYQTTAVFEGNMKVDTFGVGKIKEGQIVRIKVDNYPDNLFGEVFGKVKSIAEIPQKGHYLIKVSLPYGMTTKSGKKLPFTPHMSGSASIFTKDLSLIERLLGPILG